MTDGGVLAHDDSRKLANILLHLPKLWITGVRRSQ
jgi:hypothetical protein